MELSKLSVTQLRQKFHNHVDTSKSKPQILQDIFKHYTFQQITDILKQSADQSLMTETIFWYWIDQFAGHYYQPDIVKPLLEAMETTRELFLTTLQDKIELLRRRFLQTPLQNLYTIDTNLDDILYYFVFKGQSVYYKLLRTFQLPMDDELTLTQRNLEFRNIITTLSPGTGQVETYEYPSIDSVKKDFTN